MNQRQKAKAPLFGWTAVPSDGRRKTLLPLTTLLTSGLHSYLAGNLVL